MRTLLMAVVCAALIGCGPVTPGFETKLAWEKNAVELRQPDGSYLMSGTYGQFVLTPPAGWGAYSYRSRSSGEVSLMFKPLTVSGIRAWGNYPEKQIGIEPSVPGRTAVQLRELRRQGDADDGSIDRVLPPIRTADGKTVYLLATYGAKADLGPTC